MRHCILRIVAPILLLVGPMTARAQIISPAPGVEMPQAYYDAVARNPRAFQFDKAWIGRTRHAREAREQYLAARPDLEQLTFETLPQSLRTSMMVAGTVEVPVIMVDFANRASAPRDTTTLQQKLFDGPNPTGTVTDLYAEMSYGGLTLTGTVYGVVQLSQSDTYYEGGQNGLSCGLSKTGELLMEALDGVDTYVDFGRYDNDGPDGIPNSGDDDGFVDFVAFVHPEKGGECGNNNIWSHRYFVGGWQAFGSDCLTEGSPYITNDASAGGGNIQIWDYTIQPLIGSGSTGGATDGCGNDTVEIGIFCHEFGHAFGLPDLYDTNGGFGRGVGRHVLMGAGNWRRPANPTHFSAWSKAELGWVIPEVVGPLEATRVIPDVESNARVFQLNIMEEKFSRKSLNATAGNYSLQCGLTPAEATARQYIGGDGYGNGWDESIRRDFTYNGSAPVTLQYSYNYDLEAGYDFGYAKIRVNGTESTLASYDGIGGGSANIDITPFLSGSGASTYQIIFQLVTDESWSDEDGYYRSGPNGPFRIDDVSVTGGGESYASGFEQYEDGWYYDFTENPHKEFFLVENRNTLNARFDQYTYGDGLYIWHIEQNMAHSSLVNDENPDDNIRSPSLPYAVKLMEADGLNQLKSGASFGDAGDMYPGTALNRALDATSTPNSDSHNGLPSNASITAISDAGPIMGATMRAGYLAPTVASIAPTQGDEGMTVQIADLLGTGFVHGATFQLSGPIGGPSLRVAGPLAVDYPASRVDWVGKAKLSGELDLTGVPAGLYDVVVLNPDGQADTLSAAFTVGTPSGVVIADFRAVTNEVTVSLQWSVVEYDPFQGFRVMRRLTRSAIQDTVSGDTLLPPQARSFVDASAAAESEYEYVLAVVFSDGSSTESAPVRVQTGAFPLALFQNHPNPFNLSTTIEFSLPTTAAVRLTIYDVAGRQVATLVNETRPGGPGSVVWDGRNAAGNPVSSGVYFYRLSTPRGAQTRKLILLK